MKAVVIVSISIEIASSLLSLLDGLDQCDAKMVLASLGVLALSILSLVFVCIKM